MRNCRSDSLTIISQVQRVETAEGNTYGCFACGVGSRGSLEGRLRFWPAVAMFERMVTVKESERRRKH